MRHLGAHAGLGPEQFADGGDVLADLLADVVRATASRGRRRRGNAWAILRRLRRRYRRRIGRNGCEAGGGSSVLEVTSAYAAFDLVADARDHAVDHVTAGTDEFIDLSASGDPAPKLSSVHPLFLKKVFLQSLEQRTSSDGG